MNKGESRHQIHIGRIVLHRQPNIEESPGHENEVWVINVVSLPSRSYQLHGLKRLLPHPRSDIIGSENHGILLPLGLYHAESGATITPPHTPHWPPPRRRLGPSCT